MTAEKLKWVDKLYQWILRPTNILRQIHWDINLLRQIC